MSAGTYAIGRIRVVFGGDGSPGRAAEYLLGLTVPERIATQPEISPCFDDPDALGPRKCDRRLGSCVVVPASIVVNRTARARAQRTGRGVVVAMWSVEAAVAPLQFASRPGAIKGVNYRHRRCRLGYFSRCSGAPAASMSKLLRYLMSSEISSLEPDQP
jgi:hypothetical protein